MARSRANRLRGPSLESPTQEDPGKQDGCPGDAVTAASRLPHKCPHHHPAHGEPRVSRATWKSSKP
eukprot:278181-Hanusia_phi.AAC.1